MKRGGGGQVLPTDAISFSILGCGVIDLGGSVCRISLAATFRAADVTTLLTLNATDFTVFDEFACVPIPALRHL